MVTEETSGKAAEVETGTATTRETTTKKMISIEIASTENMIGTLMERTKILDLEERAALMMTLSSRAESLNTKNSTTHLNLQQILSSDPALSEPEEEEVVRIHKA